MNSVFSSKSGAIDRSMQLDLRPLRWFSSSRSTLGFSLFVVYEHSFLSPTTVEEQNTWMVSKFVPNSQKCVLLGPKICSSVTSRFSNSRHVVKSLNLSNDTN